MAEYEELEDMVNKPLFKIIKSTTPSQLAVLLRAYCGKNISKTFEAENISGEDYVQMSDKHLDLLVPYEAGNFRNKLRLELFGKPEDDTISNEGGTTPKSACKRQGSEFVGIPSAKQLKTEKETSSPIPGKVIKKTEHIDFCVYRSKSLIDSKITNKLDEDARTTLVQVTVENLRSALAEEGLFREPTTYELQDVAKQLCDEYPVLGKKKDDQDDEYYKLIHVSLRRRVTNTKYRTTHKDELQAKGKKSTPKKKLDLDPKESDDECILIDKTEESPEKTARESDEEDDETKQDSNDEVDEDANQLEMKKYYEQLEEAMGCERKNWTNIHQIMNLEFPARAVWVNKVKYSGYGPRVDAILEAYPAFRNVNVLLFEMRRWQEGDKKSYLKTTAARMKQLLDLIIMYGVKEQVITIEDNDVDTKVQAVLKNLTKIFPSKNKKARCELFIETNADEVSKLVKNSEMPCMLLADDEITFAVGGAEMGIVDKPKTMADWAKHIMVYMAMFYSFRFGYPHSYESALCIIQKLGLDEDPTSVETKGSDYDKQLEKFQLFVTGKAKGKGAKGGKSSNKK